MGARRPALPQVQYYSGIHAARSPDNPALSPHTLLPRPGGHCPRRPRGPLCTSLRRGHAAVRRRLHQAHPHDDRPHHLLIGRHRHRVHRRHPQARPRRPQGPALFRSGLHPGARDRPGGRRLLPARPRHERRPRARSTRNRSPPTPAPLTSSALRISCSTSSPTRSSTRSARAKSCRCCCSPSSPAWP